MAFIIKEKYPKLITLKEQLLEYKHTNRNPKANIQDISKAYIKTKALIDEHVKEDYIKEMFYARFLQLKTWTEIGMLCNGLTNDCVRKIVTRHIKKIEREI